jgi:hypothetical protein
MAIAALFGGGHARSSGCGCAIVAAGRDEEDAIRKN